MAAIEPARPEDIVAIQQIVAQVFTGYGDYANMLPKFFSAQGVSTYTARIGKDCAGFVMFGFMPWTGGAKNSSRWIADILAIGVQPKRQRQGIGGALLAKVVSLSEEMQEWRDLQEIQLTCARDNQPALAFFRSHGFQVVDAEHGQYAAGQAAVRLSRPLPVK